MLPADVHLWHLSTAGEGNLGLCRNQDGLLLGRTALIERRAGGYILRAPSDLERLFKHSADSIELARLRRGIGVIKSALDENNLPLAQIAAVQLRIPDLPDLRARAALEAEDRLIKAEQTGGLLARADWVISDPASEIKSLSRGRTAFYDQSTNTLVIVNPNASDFGTTFRPDRKRGYLDELD